MKTFWRDLDRSRKTSIKIPLDTTEGPVPDPHERSRVNKKRLLGLSDFREEVEKLKKALEAMDADAAPLTKEQHARYMSVIGTVQCIAVVTRPDIAFAAATLARYMSCPTSHLLNCVIINYII